MNYADAPNALLRLGIMVSSSTMEDGYLTDFYKMTSSVLVANKDGELFITVATHVFHADGLVYHPNPISGSVIGRIVKKLHGTDISM